MKSNTLINCLVQFYNASTFFFSGVGSLRLIANKPNKHYVLAPMLAGIKRKLISIFTAYRTIITVFMSANPILILNLNTKNHRPRHTMNFRILISSTQLMIPFLNSQYSYKTLEYRLFLKKWLTLLSKRKLKNLMKLLILKQRLTLRL